jgi:DNA primase large subunit
MILCSYDKPPLFDVTLEQFETWALARLRILAEIESAQARNRSWEDVKTSTNLLCKKYLPLSSNTNTGADLDGERRKDHVGHFVLRLAFCRGTDDVRRRYVNLETALFRIRYEGDDASEREEFLGSRDFRWIEASCLVGGLVESIPTLVFPRSRKKRRPSLSRNSGTALH